MTDIGYIQTKVRELREQVEEFNKESEMVKTQLNTLKQDFEFKKGEVNNVLKDIERIKGEIDEKAINDKIKIQVDDRIRTKEARYDNHIEELLNVKQQEINKKSSLDILNIKNSLGEEMIKDVLYILNSFAQVFFTLNKKLIEKKLIEKGSVPHIFMFKNKYGGKDRIIIFDFEKEDLEIQEGFGMVDKWARKYRLKVDLTNDPSVRRDNLTRIRPK